MNVIVHRLNGYGLTLSVNNVSIGLVSELRYVWVVYFDDADREDFNVRVFDRKKYAMKFVAECEQWAITYTVYHRKINESYKKYWGE